MVHLTDKRITKSPSCIKVEFSYMVGYQNALEIEADNFYLPVIWTEVLKHININDKILFQLFFDKIRKNEVNRVTEYKGIWGLLHMDRGIFNSHFDIDEEGKRVYFGIKEVDRICFTNKSSTAFLLDSSANVSEEISRIQDHICQLFASDKVQIINKIIDENPQISVLDYEIGRETIKATLYSNELVI